MKDDRIVQMPGTQSLNKDVFNEEEFSKLTDDVLKTMPGIAKVYRGKYLCLVKEGFTKEEALAIILSRGPFEA